MVEKISAVVVCVIAAAVIMYAATSVFSRAQQIHSERLTIVAQLDAEVKEQEEARWRAEEVEADKYYHQKFALQKQKQLRQQKEIQHQTKAARSLDTLYTDMLRNGAIYSMDVEFNEVRIDPVQWMSLDLRMKQDLVMAFSYYFELKGSTKRVTVRSSLNDTKMATYGSWGGLKILF